MSVADPYSAFGVGELADTKFILFSDDPTYWELSLSLSAAGTKTLGAGGRPRIGQSGDAGSPLGLTDVTSAFIATYDKGAAAYDNGVQDGRNAILMQSSGASGTTLDLALVFDLSDIAERVTSAFVITNPESGSFTFDSAIAAADAV